MKLENANKLSNALTRAHATNDARKFKRFMNILMMMTHKRIKEGNTGEKVTNRDIRRTAKGVAKVRKNNANKAK